MQGPTLDHLPAELQPAVSQHWQQFQDRLDQDDAKRLAARPDSFWQQLARVWGCSDFVAGYSSRQPAQLLELIDDLGRPYPQGHYAEQLGRALAGAGDEAALQRILRQFRNREMVRIIWRDLTRSASLEQTTGDLSDLADACIDQALNWLYRWACDNWGTPYSRGNEQTPAEPQQLVVLGMGKLGAQELNLSSDIDLIFAFPENGETQGGRRCLDNQTFFNRLGQKLIQALDNNTADGFVFRVDMRLRPYGQSGILAPCFAAMEEYYQDQGRDWERYAMIKARVVAGDQQAGRQLMDSLKPFVYRKYLDFSAFEALRSMKTMINREVRRKNLQGNVKLGSGGIREVEFIAQAFQLIRGGRDARLQQRELRHILPLLPDTVGMPEAAVTELLDAYTFLRNSEHAIQAYADQQTQELPNDEEGRTRLAFAMGFEDWQGFYAALGHHRSRVERHFAEVIAPVQEEDEAQGLGDWQSLWFEELDPAAAVELLRAQGHEDAEETLRLLDNLRGNRKLELMQQVGRERLDNLMPLLLEAVGHCPNPSQTLARTLQLVEAVLRRSAYFVLLIENPGALTQLVRLCSASNWFANLLAKQPILLDELIDVHSLYNPPDKAALQDELRQQLLRLPEDDVEQQMEALRYFKNAHVLRVAAAEITGALPLMKVSDYLTYIAEVILDGALKTAWRMLTEKHGFPQRDNGEPCDPDFVIVGYGKVGGIELSYGSDLDLVFVHDAATDRPTDGPKPLDCQVFFTRLGQRIIHLLNTATTSGQLYEVDMRLRPSGNSGLLVSSVKAFREYQFNDAWTWEHQALVRARVVAGCPRVKARFEAVREEVLRRSRDREQLRQEVLEMRLKMRDHLGSKPAKEGESGVFHLKHDAGGIVDIEFLVQYLTLANAETYPQLIEYTDNIRILEAIEGVGLLPAADAELLREAYKAYRSAGHRLSLQGQSNLISDQEMRELRGEVAAIWDREFGTG